MWPRGLGTHGNRRVGRDGVYARADPRVKRVPVGPQPIHPPGGICSGPAVGALRSPGHGSGRRVPPLYSPLVDRRSNFGCLFEVVETLVLTLVIFFVIQNFVAQPYQVHQNSMERTLLHGQFVLVDKLTPRWDDYGRGDVVVFSPPTTWAEDPTPFIKRVIGLPGDTVEIRDDGLVYVNGVDLEEPYLYANEEGIPEPTTAALDQRMWVVPADQLFVMGDHRQSSADSRVFGPISRSDVIGRAFLRYWPISTVGILQTPTYPDVPATGTP